MLLAVCSLLALGVLVITIYELLLNRGELLPLMMLLLGVLMLVGNIERAGKTIRKN